MTQCSVFEIIFNVPNFYGFSIDILRMRGCVVLALEEWVVLYIIDTRRSLDLGLFCFPSTIQAFLPIMVMVILWLDF